MSERIVDREHEEARRKRLGLLPDDSEISRRLLAITVLANDRPLERHECLFIARLLDPKLVAAITKRKIGRGKPVSNATALKADQIAESYFVDKALGPHKKHKEELAPNVADFYGVSPSYVDKVLRNLDPTRRAELKCFAASIAEDFEKSKASPQGEAMWAEHEAALKRPLPTKRKYPK